MAYQRGDQQRIQRHDQRYADIKTGLSGLVSEQLHAQEHTKAAATYGDAKEGGFRDAPGRFYGGALVDKHNYQPGSIDYNQVKSNEL